MTGMMKKNHSNSIPILKGIDVKHKEIFKHGNNASEMLRRLKIQNKKLLEQVLNMKKQLKETKSENKRMKKHLDDWLKLKKLIIQSAWKY